MNIERLSSKFAVRYLTLDYPKEKVAFLGLFMMEQEYQGKGVGTEIIQKVTGHGKGKYKIST